jgi:hypothetical protein
MVLLLDFENERMVEARTQSIREALLGVDTRPEREIRAAGWTPS